MRTPLNGEIELDHGLVGSPQFLQATAELRMGDRQIRLKSQRLSSSIFPCRKGFSFDEQVRENVKSEGIFRVQRHGSSGPFQRLPYLPRRLQGHAQRQQGAGFGKVRAAKEFENLDGLIQITRLNLASTEFIHLNGRQVVRRHAPRYQRDPFRTSACQRTTGASVRR